MGRYAPIVVAVGLLAAAPDHHEIEGTWTITSITKDGQEREESLKITFEEGKYTLPSPEGFTESKEGQYTLDPEEMPKQITLKPTDGPNEGKPIMGIYRVEGDRMEACYDPSGAGRPMRFEAQRGTGYVLATYEKGKP